MNWRQKIRHRRSHRQFSVSTLTNRTKLYARYSKLIFILVTLGLLSLVIIFPFIAVSLPSPDKIVRRDGFSTKILDRSGVVLYDIYADQKRTPVQLSDVPDYLKQATVAIEDKNFYKHKGFDPIGVIRGLSRIITSGRAQGGSTLTQQLVKNVLLSSERSVIRKIKELVITLQIENRYSKDDILQMYLNEVPYGGTSWGVEAATETYFGKKVQELNLTESAFLAGLPQRPSYYSPYSSNPTAYIGRTQEVLRRMREDGYITKNQEEQAKKDLDNLEFQSKDASFKAPHFVSYVKEMLEERYGEKTVEQGGLKVTTTLDYKLQEQAQKIVSEEVVKAESLKIGNGAAVVIDSNTGEILSMVGSKDFNAKDYDGQVNVTLSLRQPGSAIKPITYVTALKKGYTPSTLIIDAPTTFPGGLDEPEYKPENYDGEYRGPIQLRYALGNSINVPAVKILSLVGVKTTLETAYEMGLSSLEPTPELLKRVGLSLTLGGGEVRLLELTSAYAAFMNQGYRVDPISILKVEDKNGKVLEETKITKGKQVLSPEQAYLIADILSDNNAREEVFGLNSLLNIPGHQIAVKTGTTNDKRDNWTIGGNPELVVGVWVGNNDNTPMLKVASGVSGASPIWRKILLEALKDRPKSTFQIPDAIITASVDQISGFRAHDDFPSRTEKFAKGTEPGEDPVHVKLKVCKGQDKLATPGDIVANNFDEKEYFVLKEEDPLAKPGEPNRWQEGIITWINEQADARYRPPTEYCSGSSNAPLNVEFIDPRDRTSNLPNELKIKFSVDSVNEIDLVELEIDGTKIRSFTKKPYEDTVQLTNGSHTLRVIAHDKSGNTSDRKIEIGINAPWNSSPTPTPTN